MKLIKLDYAVLSMLADEKLSGYDITARLQEVWKTSHSRIYPVLAKLEKAGLVHYEHLEQENRPDKKIYTITDAGIDVLKQWLITKPARSIKKNEGLLRMMGQHLVDREDREKFINEHIKEISREKERLEKIFQKIKKEANANLTDTQTKYFSAYVVSEITTAILSLEAVAGEWFLDLLNKKNVTNYYDYKFTDYLHKRFAKCLADSCVNPK